MRLSVQFKGTLHCLHIAGPDLRHLATPDENGSCELQERLKDFAVSTPSSDSDNMLLGGTDPGFRPPPVRELQMGWFSVHEEQDDDSGALVDVDLSSEFMVMHYRVIRRSVSDSELRKRVNDQVDALRHAGKRVGRDMKKAITEEVQQSLLLHIEPKYFDCPVAIDLRNGLLFICATAGDHADMIIHAMQMILPDAEFAPVAEHGPIERLMAAWLMDRNLPGHLTLGDSVDFCDPTGDPGDKAGLISYKKHILEEVEEVATYALSKRVQRLAMHQGSRLSFSLTPSLKLMGLKLSKPSSQPAAPLRLLSKPMSEEEYQSMMAAEAQDEPDELEFADRAYFLLHLVRDAIENILRDARELGMTEEGKGGNILRA